ncbi:unnamed protein product, partial [Effrenium voratum]
AGQPLGCLQDAAPQPRSGGGDLHRGRPGHAFGLPLRAPHRPEVCGAGSRDLRPPG